MVIVDANVLLYAVDSTAVHHAKARTWLDASLSGAEAVGLAWVALLAFVRICTNPSILSAPMPIGDAVDQLDRWLGAPAAVVAGPTSRHLASLAGLLREAGTGGNLTTDAHLAALALEHNADVVSYDRDFARFRGVRHRLPG
jgi:toxin-antitoxin system PIN domain toxin